MASNQGEGGSEFGPLVVGRKAGRPTLPKEIREGIADRLRTLWKGLELKDVAKRLGYDPGDPVHVKQVQRYQAPTNAVTPDPSILIRISTAFDIGLDHLVFGQSRHVPLESLGDVNLALRAAVTEELRRKYDYDSNLIEEMLEKDLLSFIVEDQSRRIKGFRATASGTDDQERFERAARESRANDST